MNNWRRVDEIIIYYGKGVTPKYVDDSFIIVLNQKCIRNNKIDFSFAQFIDDKKSYNEDKFLKVGDLLVNSTGQGTAGRVAMVDYIPEGYKIIVDSHILVLRTNDFFESKCLNYSLFSIESLLQTFMDGSTGQGEFDKTRLFNVKVGYSRDNKTQYKIAAVLSAFDYKIELNNKINTELEAMAKTLYDYWFVQFEFPNTEGKPYKSSGGVMEYNPNLKRDIPKIWEVKRLNEIAKTGSGGTPKSTIKEYYEEGKIPWINSGELNNPFIVSTNNFISDLGMKNSSAKLFPSNTILMAMYGATAGKTSVISFEATTNQAICAVMPYDKNKFYYTKFVLDDMYQYLINLSTGSARDNLSQDKIKELSVVIPCNDILNNFEKVISPNFNKIKTNLMQNQELAQLRDWLLPMLMNGQVKVENAEEQVLDMVAEPGMAYEKAAAINKVDTKEDRFSLWLSTQKSAARGTMDEVVLREIFDGMDDEDQ